MVAGARPSGRHPRRSERLTFSTSGDLRSDLRAIGLSLNVHRVRLRRSRDVGEEFQRDFAVQVIRFLKVV